MNKTKRSHSILLYTCNSATGFKLKRSRVLRWKLVFFFVLSVCLVCWSFFWSMLLLLRLLLVFVASLRISNQQFYTKTNRQRPQTNRTNQKKKEINKPKISSIQYVLGIASHFLNDIILSTEFLCDFWRRLLDCPILMSHYHRRFDLCDSQ